MILQSIKMALKSIGSNKLRTFLTMLGIIIGVLAVCLIMTLVTAISTMVIDEFGNLGSNFCQANISTSADQLTLADIELLKETKADVYKACAFDGVEATVTLGQYSDSKRICFSTGSDFQNITGLQLDSGRYINSLDNENGAQVMVLSYKTAQELFGSPSRALGQYAYIAGFQAKVVGVMKKATLTSDTFGDILVPYSMYMTMFQDRFITTIIAMAPDSTKLSACVTELGEFLDEHYNSVEKVYSVRTMEADINTYNNIASALRLLMFGVTAVSLIVGGIGIMNIMLVSVSERTREIGIRKAIGANRGTILIQFLLESVIISALGAALGVVLAYLLVPLIRPVAESMLGGVSLTMEIAPATVLLAVCSSVLIGVLFGISPANQAAKLRPIEALRHE